MIKTLSNEEKKPIGRYFMRIFFPISDQRNNFSNKSKGFANAI